MQGADNVFTQHTPLLAATLADFLIGQLNVDGYPFLGMSQVSVLSGLLHAALDLLPPDLICYECTF